jgi:D-ornithine 4,5-aminomutase subunit alpha
MNDSVKKNINDTDFELRRAHLKNLTDQELKDKFWEMAYKIVEPLAQAAQKHTSPSIERSVLMRMGFDSVSSREITDKINEQGFLGKGAGNIILKAAKQEKCSIKEAGRKITEGMQIKNLFGGSNEQ